MHRARTFKSGVNPTHGGAVATGHTLTPSHSRTTFRAGGGGGGGGRRGAAKKGGGLGLGGGEGGCQERGGGSGLNWSGVDPPLSSSRACLTTFIAISVP